MQKAATNNELIKGLLSGADIILMNNINLSDMSNIVVKSKLDLNGFTINPDYLFPAPDTFMFTLIGGAIYNGTIKGPNGSVVAFPSNQFWGAVKSDNGLIENVTFKDCDKWAIYGKGTRASNTDITIVRNCVFNNIKRDGYGYAIWNQYNHIIVDGCWFDDCRHFIDQGSEASSWEIRNCVFGERRYQPAIHMHEYGGIGKSGRGMLFENNYVFGTWQPFQIYNSYGPKSVFINNHFECSYENIGTINGNPLTTDSGWGDNYYDGEGMLPAPVITGRGVYEVGEKVELFADGYNSYVWEEPVIKRGVGTYLCYGIDENGMRSRMAKKTVTIKDSSGVKYLSFSAKCKGTNIEVLDGLTIIDRIAPDDFESFSYEGSALKLRLNGGGELYLDDWARENSAETFESTGKLKVYNYVGAGIKTGRFIGERSSGLWGFRFTLPALTSVLVQ